MLNIDAKVIGADVAAASVLSAADAARERIREALRGAGREIQAAARARAAVKTGALQRSIRSTVRDTKDGVRLTVKPSKFYARFIEFGVVNHGSRGNLAPAGNKRGKVARVRALRASGRYRIAPRPFMGPAVEAVRGRIESMIKAAVDTVAKG